MKGSNILNTRVAWTVKSQPMEQINTDSLYFLGKWMDSVFLQAKLPLKSTIGAWISLKTVLNYLLTGASRLRLSVSAPAAANLRNVVDDAISKHTADENYQLDEAQLQAFNTAWGIFEQALLLELGRAPVFFVTPKGIYSTPDLINYAEYSLMPDVMAAISDEAKNDLNQAGRCLAFELATASGYHALRASEKVLREYYERTMKASGASIGMKHCIDQIRANGGEPKTLAVLDQVRDLHRNPIDHPEVFLTYPEAMELFSICTSAISAMARQIVLLPKWP